MCNAEAVSALHRQQERGVMGYQAGAQGGTGQVRTCKGAGGPSTAVTSRELSVSFTGICAKSNNYKASKQCMWASAQLTAAVQASCLTACTSLVMNALRAHATYNTSTPTTEPQLHGQTIVRGVHTQRPV